MVGIWIETALEIPANEVKVAVGGTMTTGAGRGITKVTGTTTLAANADISLLTRALVCWWVSSLLQLFYPSVLRVSRGCHTATSNRLSGKTSMYRTRFLSSDTFPAPHLLHLRPQLIVRKYDSYRSSSLDTPKVMLESMEILFFASCFLFSFSKCGSLGVSMHVQLVLSAKIVLKVRSGKRV